MINNNASILLFRDNHNIVILKTSTSHPTYESKTSLPRRIWMFNYSMYYVLTNKEDFSESIRKGTFYDFENKSVHIKTNNYWYNSVTLGCYVDMIEHILESEISCSLSDRLLSRKEFSSLSTFKIKISFDMKHDELLCYIKTHSHIISLFVIFISKDNQLPHDIEVLIINLFKDLHDNYRKSLVEPIKFI